MIKVFLEGMLLGLIVSFTFGPAFFTIIQTSIDRGFKPAMYISLGVLICDTFLICICFFGMTSIFDHITPYKKYLGFIGGIVLIIYGTYMYLKKPDILKRRSAKHKTPPAPTSHFKYIVKGFFMNIFNPFILLFWLTAVTSLTAVAEEGKLYDYFFVFFGGVLMTLFASDLTKSFVGFRIKKYLRPRVQLWINRIVGLFLIVFGIILMIRVIL
jgi:threonine/homoserine/homoserine lactone efflux protein